MSAKNIKPGRNSTVPVSSSAYPLDNLLLSLSSSGNQYHKIAENILISVNNSKISPSDATSKVYAKSFADNQPMPPHAYSIAASAFSHMIVDKEDQSLLLAGESGSGKSTSHNLITRQLCDLSKVSKKKSRIHSAVLRVDSVLSALFHASTITNSNKSFSSRYVEYQFDVTGKMVGAKYISFGLDRNWLTDPKSGRNFHIFYYLLNGLSSEEKQRMHLHLHDRPDHFTYLSNGAKQDAKPSSQDVASFEGLQENLKSLGIGRRQQSQLYQLMAAILNLGNIHFVDDDTSNESCSVKNSAQLEVTAELLGVEASALEAVLTSKTRLVRRDLISVYLDAKSALLQRDALARSLYAIATTWIIDQINNKLCREDTEWKNFIAVFDPPGLYGRDSYAEANDFWRLLTNYGNTRLSNFINEKLFDETRSKFFEAEGLGYVQRLYSSSKTALELFDSDKRHQPGLFSFFDSLVLNASRVDFPASEEVLETMIKEFAFSSSFLTVKSTPNVFGVRHNTDCTIEYSVEYMCDRNLDVVQDDFVGMVSGYGSINKFFKSLVIDHEENTPNPGETIKRAPSIKRKKDIKVEKKSLSTVSSIFRNSLGEIMSCLNETRPWFIIHILPSSPESLYDADFVKAQLSVLDLDALKTNPISKFSAWMPMTEFDRRYGDSLNANLRVNNPSYGLVAGESLKVSLSRCLLEGKGWSKEEVCVAKTHIFLSEKVWSELEYILQEYSGRRDVDLASNVSKSVFGGDDYSYISDAESRYSEDLEPISRRPSIEIELGNSGKKSDAKPQPEVKKISRQRCHWLCCVWGISWWIPPLLLSRWGKMNRKDQQIAWREKVALCVIILMLNMFILFFIIGLGWILCAPKPQLSPGEIQGHNKLDDKPYVQMYGSYYDMSRIAPTHIAKGYAAKVLLEESTLGQDVAEMFTRQNVWNTYCSYAQPPIFQLFPNPSPKFNGPWVSHQTLQATKDYSADLKSSIKGAVVWDETTIGNFLKDINNKIIIAYDRIYDISAFSTAQYNTNFLGDSTDVQKFIKDVFEKYGPRGGDSTGEFEKLKSAFPDQFVRVKQCMDGLLLRGFVDHRQDLKCVAPNYILLASAAILVSIIGFKFLAALQLGSRRQPESHEKFVICQVPCYTEDELSLSRTLNSLALLDYDDKRKLLFVICDGMIIGTGNDRPTPRIVLDLLGVDPALDPDALAFQSLGEGNKQLNYGKVYSGLYEVEGRAVPFVVVVKIGKPSERQRPGNRGKRDSQMLLMRFLSRVHLNQPFAPLELDIYHNIRNVIGVEPAFYEFVLMVDADTEVEKDSLNRMVSCMSRDSKILGICGETRISNENKSWVTMMQVYEYYISHHLAKAFESLFGSVTCLPGCFTMYRLRSPVKNLPLLVSPGVIADYSENTVDTLHLKNLLHLGEDRYLTTLLLKHFPNYKTTFTADARAKTVCPDKWSVILSQRRRWINSTVHNLIELVSLKELCGFCCFSMRFIVFIDLFATLVQPAALLYIIYIVFLAIWSPDQNRFPLISIVLICCVYGFQVIIFLFKQEWQHIGWMFIYILATPLFAFWLPLYSFWHFDDFGWGSTRRVVGEDKKTHFIQDVDEFDLSLIPLRDWDDHDRSRAERSERSEYDSQAGDKKSPTAAYSAYGGGSGYSGDYSSVYSAAPSVPYNTPPGPPTNRDSYMSFGTGGIAANRASWISTSDSNIAVLPSDQELLNQVKGILATADLMTVSKKNVREELSRHFGGLDLSSKKEYIHRCIDQVLRNEM